MIRRTTAGCHPPPTAASNFHGGALGERVSLRGGGVRDAETFEVAANVAATSRLRRSSREPFAAARGATASSRAEATGGSRRARVVPPTTRCGRRARGTRRVRTRSAGARGAPVASSSSSRTRQARARRLVRSAIVRHSLSVSTMGGAWMVTRWVFETTARRHPPPRTSCAPGGPRESARGHLRAIGATEKCAVEEEAGATPRFDDVVGEGGVDVGLVGGALGVRARGVGVVRQGDEPGVPAEIRGAHHAHAALHPDREKVVRGPRQRAGVPARGLPQRAFHRAQPGRHPARRKMRRGARGGSGSRC